MTRRYYNDPTFTVDEQVKIYVTGEVVTYKGRCNRNRKPKDDGLYALVHRAESGPRGAEGERCVKYAWLRSIAPPPEPAPVRQECSPSPEAPQPVACETQRKQEPWKANEKRGAIYLDEEPGGTYRAALVCPKINGEGSEQLANAKGLSPDDLEDQLMVLVRRLVRRARNLEKDREEVDAC
jgi:hypothetical protein